MISNSMFPNLEKAIAARGIKISVICKRLGISERAFLNKRTGVSEFTWREVFTIQSHFFPDLSPSDLFSSE